MLNLINFCCHGSFDVRACVLLPLSNVCVCRQKKCIKDCHGKAQKKHNFCLRAKNVAFEI
jgi:hypothetical protein